VLELSKPPFVTIGRDLPIPFPFTEIESGDPAALVVSMINPDWLEVSTGVYVIVSFELSEGAIEKTEGESL
jgi:hypothetical protein